jgi:acetyltransferase-like isoleucine patch superfamily enzyme
VRELQAYSDERGNRIEYDGPNVHGVNVKFTGANNILSVSETVRLNGLNVDFDCDGGRVSLGGSSGPRFSAAIRVGEESLVRIGHNVSSTTPVAISAAEATTISIGDDVMIATDVQIRADDGHPIFDVHSGRRVNVSRCITIEDHVWLGFRAAVLGGVTIGEGSVVGMYSVVTRSLPNNVVAVGMPAKIVRRDIAWERPHLTLTEPYLKPDASVVTRSPYWNVTQDLRVNKARPGRYLDGLRAMRAALLKHVKAERQQ